MFRDLKTTKDTIIDLSNCTIPKNNPVVKAAGYMFASSPYITEIKFPENLKIGSALSWFSGCTKLSSVDMSGLDFSECTNMSNMFASCSSLVSLDVSSWNTSKVTNMSSLFIRCTNLQTITGLENWNTSKVNDMSYAFYGCAIESIDTSVWNVSNVTNAGNFCSGCNSLKNIILSIL